MRPLAGTAALTRLALRRDLPTLLAWTALFATLLAATAASFRDTYPDDVALRGYAAAMDAAPIQRFFNGPGAGLDTHGGMLVFEVGGYLVVVVALLSVLTTVRHSRAEEANGDAELVRAGRVGRHSLDASAAIVATCSAGWWGLTCAATLGVLGVGWSGALAYGLSVAAAGTVFAAVAAVASQLGELPRTATGIAATVLALAFVLRGLGDLDRSELVWASPLGWAQAVRPFGNQRAWPLIVCLGAAVAGHLVAAALCSRRDLGAGWWRPRPGPATASSRLRRLGGLVATEALPVARGWWPTLAGLGLVFGLVSREFSASGDRIDLSSLVPDADDAVTGLVDLAGLLLAILASAAGVAVVAAAAGEERTGRADLVLTTAVGRLRWVGWHGAAALIVSGVGVVLSAIGLAAGLTLADVTTTVTAADTLTAVLAHLPATWLVVALAAMVFGAWPRGLALAWVPVAYAVITGLFGSALRLPGWAMDLSPFHHAPGVLAESPFPVASGTATGLAVCLLALGATGFARRDVGT